MSESAVHEKNKKPQTSKAGFYIFFQWQFNSEKYMLYISRKKTRKKEYR